VHGNHISTGISAKRTKGEILMQVALLAALADNGTATYTLENEYTINIINQFSLIKRFV
jgi:hypothetical protein